MKIRFAPAISVALMVGALSGPVFTANLNQAPQSLPGQQSGGPAKSIPPTSSITGPAAGSGAATSTTPSAAGAAKLATGERRAALVKLLSSPDNAVVSVGGKSISAGQLRGNIRSVASKFAKAPRRVAMKGVSAPSASQSALSSQNSAVLTELKEKLTGAGGGRTGRTTALASAPAGPSKPCDQRPPFMGELKGSLTPGGIVAFDGSCFGSAQGEVRMYGDFPHGYISLPVQMWADGGTAATVPADLVGVLDQPAHIAVVRRSDGQQSNLRTLAFVAGRQTLQIPPNLVQLVACTDFPNDCAASAASHYSNSGDDGSVGLRFGTDTWRVTVGNGWALQSLDTAYSFGSITAAGFDQGPPNTATFNFQWVGDTLSATTTHATFFDLVGETQTQYLAAYSFSITAVGPAGVSPDPAVKPAYSYAAKPGGAETSIRGAALTPNPMPDAAASQSIPASNKPVWNTIIGSSPAAGSGTRPSSSVRPVQFPGQPTPVAPGAPVQTSQ